MSEKGSEQRQFDRVDFREPVQYQIGDGQTFIGCLGHDIGEGGIRVNWVDFIPINTELQLNIKLTDENMADLKGKVVWVQQIPFSDQFQIGVKFLEDNVSPKAKEVIHQYIQSHRF